MERLYLMSMEGEITDLVGTSSRYKMKGGTKIRSRNLTDLILLHATVLGSFQSLNLSERRHSIVCKSTPTKQRCKNGVAPPKRRNQ